MEIIAILIAVGLYLMVGSVSASWAKAQEYPVWSRLLALTGWPLLMVVGLISLFWNLLKDIIKD